MEIKNLKQVNLSHITLRALLISCSRKDDLLQRVEPGVHDTVRIVTEMLSRGVDDESVKVSDVIEMIGGNTRKMKKNINNAIRISCEKYDGELEPPEPIPVEHFIYLVTVLAIKEYGISNEDNDEAIVMAHLTDFVDISAVSTESDMRCFIFLIDYLTKCLQENKRVSLTHSLKNYGSRYVTRRRLKDFFRKNDWFSETSLEPSTLIQIFNYLFKSLEKVRQVEAEMDETYRFTQEARESCEDEG